MVRFLKFLVGLLGVWATAWLPFLPILIIFVPPGARSTVGPLWTLTALIVYGVLVWTGRAWPYARPTQDSSTELPPNVPMGPAKEYQAMPMGITSPRTSGAQPAKNAARIKGGRTVQQQPSPRRQVSIPLPPAWLLFNLVVLGGLAAGVWADREYLQWYSDSERVGELEAELARVRGSIPSSVSSVDSRARADVVRVDGQVNRVISLASFSFSLEIQERESLGSEATQALYQRCAEWARSGGDFETACR